MNKLPFDVKTEPMVAEEKELRLKSLFPDEPIEVEILNRFLPPEIFNQTRTQVDLLEGGGKFVSTSLDIELRPKEKINGGGRSFTFSIMGKGPQFVQSEEFLQAKKELDREAQEKLTKRSEEIRERSKEHFITLLDALKCQKTISREDLKGVKTELVKQREQFRYLHKAFWGSYDNKQLSSDSRDSAFGVTDALGELWDVVERNLPKEIKMKIGEGSLYAYTPHEGIGSTASGARHSFFKEGFSKGKYERKEGDPLCKPASKFWGMEKLADDKGDCLSCMEKMISFLPKNIALEPEETHEITPNRGTGF